MKQLTTLLTAAIVLGSSTYALADKKHHGYREAPGHVEYARVIDAHPIYEKVRHKEPVQECHIEERLVNRRHGGSQTPVILGSIIGGAIGNELGHSKTNKKVGVVVGSILGGAIASDLNRGSGHSHQRIKHEKVCNTTYKVSYEQQVVGYDVKYKYQGRIYKTVMDNHPGKRIRVAVDVTPLGV